MFHSTRDQKELSNGIIKADVNGSCNIIRKANIVDLTDIQKNEEGLRLELFE